MEERREARKVGIRRKRGMGRTGSTEHGEEEWGHRRPGMGDRMRDRTFRKPSRMEEQDQEKDYLQWDRAARAKKGLWDDEEEGTGRRKGVKGERLETRIEALERGRRLHEKERAMDRARAGLNTKLRRLQSGVLAFDHPGLFSHIDQMVTMHEAPDLHKGPMCVARATWDILKVPHIKLSYLADAIWEFTRRKCAEAGEHLTDQQVLEIEAKVMEYFGKQRVEAGNSAQCGNHSGKRRQVRSLELLSD
jgi:hypothetical protein